jgi:hypothetical protein
MPYPASYTEPENPNWYTKRWEEGVVLEAVTTTEVPGVAATGVCTEPTVVKRSDSAGSKVAELSLGGMMCAFLILSAFAL